jgi:hypothetical protein
MCLKFISHQLLTSFSQQTVRLRGQLRCTVQIVLTLNACMRIPLIKYLEESVLKDFLPTVETDFRKHFKPTSSNTPVAIH